MQEIPLTSPKKRGIMMSCGYSSSVEHQLPKLGRRVRFPLSAFLFLQEKRKNQGLRLR